MSMTHRVQVYRANRVSNEAYYDGRTNARTFARTHTEAERWAEALRVERVLLTSPDLITQRACEGWLDILDNWLDGRGA